jgi:hypothetical protein
MADNQVKGIRRIKSLTRGNIFQDNQIIVQGLRLRYNTTVGVLVREGKAGEITVGLVLQREISETNIPGITIGFGEAVDLALLPAMAISTEVMVSALTPARSWFGFKGLSARIFEVVIREFGQIKFEVVPDAQTGREDIQMTVEAGDFRTFAKRAIVDLKEFFKKVEDVKAQNQAQG